MQDVEIQQGEITQQMQLEQQEQKVHKPIQLFPVSEGSVINIYSWNDEFRERLEAVYPEVESTSRDGTVTTLKDGTEIHWIINPNQDGVYQQKLDEALYEPGRRLQHDDKVDIFLI